MSTATHHQHEGAFWDRIAPKYARKPVSDPGAYEAKLDHVGKLLNADDRVLEIGCGTGSTALHLSPFVAEIIATDISHEMIKIAEGKRVESGANNVRFLQAGAAKILPQGPFDVIMAFSLLHLVSDVPKVLEAVFAQLKPGGLFLSKTVCLGDANFSLRLLVRVLGVIGVAPPIVKLSKEGLSEALVAAGFILIEHRYFGKSRRNPFIVAKRPT